MSRAYYESLGVTGAALDRAVATNERLAASRKIEPERKPRAGWSQAALDSQPERKARARYRRTIVDAKQRAAAPLRSRRPQQGLEGLSLLGGIEE